MPSQRTAVTVTPNSGTPISASTTITNDAVAGIGPVNLPSAQTNVPYDIGAPAARMKSYVLYSPVATTIKTNSSSDPDDTIALPAGVMVTWNTSSLGENLFTTDIDKIYVTNVLAAPGFIFEVIYDPTA